MTRYPNFQPKFFDKKLVDVAEKEKQQNFEECVQNHKDIIWKFYGKLRKKRDEAKKRRSKDIN